MERIEPLMAIYISLSGAPHELLTDFCMRHEVSNTLALRAAIVFTRLEICQLGDLGADMSQLDTPAIEAVHSLDNPNWEIFRRLPYGAEFSQHQSNNVLVRLKPVDFHWAKSAMKKDPIETTAMWVAAAVNGIVQARYLDKVASLLRQKRAAKKQKSTRNSEAQN